MVQTKNKKLNEQKVLLVNENDELEEINNEKIQNIIDLRTQEEYKDATIFALRNKQKELKKELVANKQKPVNRENKVLKHPLRMPINAKAWSDVITYGLNIIGKVNDKYFAKDCDLLDDLIIDILNELNKEIMARNNQIQFLKDQMFQDNEELELLREQIGEKGMNSIQYPDSFYDNSALIEDDTMGLGLENNIGNESDLYNILANLKVSKATAEYIDRSIAERSFKREYSEWKESTLSGREDSRIE